MDVVKTNIERLGGHVELDSTAGKGTLVRIRLPLTLAIIPSLTVGTAGQRYAVPQVNVQELVRIRAADVPRRIEKLGKVEVLRLREKLLPLVCLADVLGLTRTITHPRSGERITERRRQLADRRSPSLADQPFHGDASPENRRIQTDRRHYCQSDINIVVLRIGAHSFGIRVDELFDNEEIVVKPLSKHIKESPCFAGATIMGDGRVAMILDAAGIAEYADLHFSEVGEEERRRRKARLKGKKKDIGTRQKILLFNNALNERFAFRLDEISRLEKISPDAIHSVGGQDYVAHLGEGLPLVYLEKLVPVTPLPRELAEFFIIIPKTARVRVGIIVSRILDTVETHVAVKQEAHTPAGFYGSAFIDGNLTLLLNPRELLALYDDSVRTG